MSQLFIRPKTKRSDCFFELLAHFYECSRDIHEYIILIFIISYLSGGVLFSKNKEKTEHITENLKKKTFRLINGECLSRGPFSRVKKKNHRKFNEIIL